MMAKRSSISIIRDMLWLTYMMIQEIMSLTTHRCCVTFQASGTCSHVSRRTWLSVHYGDVIMGAIASQITSLTIVYSSVYSDADQRKYQSSAPLAFVRGIHRRPVNSPHKWPVTRKCFHLMTSSWYQKRNNDTTKQHTDYAKDFWHTLTILCHVTIIVACALNGAIIEHPYHVVTIKVRDRSRGRKTVDVIVTDGFVFSQRKP